jgi:hypothetical protein
LAQIIQSNSDDLLQVEEGSIPVVPAAFGVTMLAALPALRTAQVNPVLALRQD